MRHLRAWVAAARRRREARAWIGANGLPVVMRAMWLLNRHARAVGRADTIYALKNVLVRTLYLRGYCAGVRLQVQTLACWYCDEDGVNDFGEICWRCDGTHVYRSHRLYRFTFVVDSRRYTWHQPERLVDFPVELGSEEPGEFKAPANHGERLPAASGDVLKATVYEWLRGAGMPAGELPWVPSLGAALIDEWHDARSAFWRAVWRFASWAIARRRRRQAFQVSDEEEMETCADEGILY